VSLISCEFIKWTDGRFDLWEFEYSLIDSNFGEVLGTGHAPFYPSSNFLADIMIVDPIIIEYSKRNLNVESNLALFLLDICRKHNYKMKSILSWFDRSNQEVFIKLWKTVDQSKIMAWIIWS
jgi:hypothetical protein